MPSLVGAITIKWNKIDGATGYVVEKSISGSAGPFAVVKKLGAGEVVYRDTDLYYNETAHYRIKTTGSAGDSPYSKIVSATTHQEIYKYKIMPLGDSNTEGGSSAIPVEQRAGYRDKLEELLNASETKGRYDFVGSESTGSALMTDTDHAGFGGARDEDIAALLEKGTYQDGTGKNRGPGGGAYLDKYNPDIILLHIGTNQVDGSQNAMNDVKRILDLVDEHEARRGREVTVVVAKIIKRVCNASSCPTPTEAENTIKYNNMLEDYVKQRAAAGDRLLLVDMQDGAGLIYKYSSEGGDMADNLHPTQKGYDKMAPVWFKVLDELLNRELTPSDVTAPDAPVVLAPAEGASMKNTKPTISGTAEADSNVEIFINGASIGKIKAGNDGKWSLTLTTALADGRKQLTATATDAAGNTSQRSSTRTFTVDNAAPETTIASKPEKLSNSSLAKFSFSSNESGVTYQVSIDEGNFANAANPFTTNNLSDGEHTLSVRAVDAAGNTDATPASYTWAIDTKAPDGPVVSAPATNQVLNTNKPAISGTAEAGSTVNIFVNGNSLATTTADKDGKWSISPSNALAEGVQQLSAKATDAAGNTSKASNIVSITIDTKAPETTIASGPAEASNSNVAKFSFSSNEQEVTYEVSLDGAAYTEAGSSYTATGLSEGNHTLAVRATDKAGNTDKTPATYSWLIDTKAPEAPTFAGITEDLGTADDDRITADNKLILYGAAEAGAEVSILEQGKLLGKAAANKKGTWEYSHESTALKQGQYTFTATATDAAGNVSDASTDFSVTIDLTAPKAEITTESNLLVNQAFSISINFTEIVFGLAASDFEVVNAQLEDFEPAGEAAYTATVTPAADGAVRIKLPAGKVIDLAGNPNTVSNSLEITYDASAPKGYAIAFVPDLVDIDNQSAVALEVTGAEAGTTYFYSINSSNGGDPITGTAAVASSSFTISDLDLTSLSDGMLTASLYLVDEVGNQGQEVTDQVRKLTKDILSVKNPASITVPFKTSFEDLGLPAEVEVSYTNGETDLLNVTWSQGDFNREVPGSYTLAGQLELKENTSNSKNRMASITVQVEPNQPPTALNLSTDSFAPDIASEEVIGTLSTTDPDDATFTYALVSGQGDEHNSLFEIRGSELYLLSNEGLSGKSNFSIRVRSTDPYQNTIEKSFALTKSLYKPDGSIELVNAFSPDGDNINDTWLVPELRYYDSVEVQVFDRSGVLLFQTTNPEKGWDGRGKDGRVLAGSFFYIIQIKDINLVKKGVLTVLK
ncbi:Ig-like domain-containing protein [uncultured Pontibacter sp.]|uniref:Ig-like domain-containing protein n=1 Tax=uncultured Pontibacter sp. TaxID=453356 RepID=UPI002616EEBE|nr:Ig-like domain-containing protein [uncultured Pontibacter sp.]